MRWVQVIGWIVLIYGLGSFLLKLEDGWVASCGGIDPADCPPVLGNLWILVRPTGVSFFIICAGLVAVFNHRRCRIPALCLLILGTLYFFLVFSKFPNFCS
jgi:hypothetical protein